MNHTIVIRRAFSDNFSGFQTFCFPIFEPRCCVPACPFSLQFDFSFSTDEVHMWGARDTVDYIGAGHFVCTGLIVIKLYSYICPRPHLATLPQLRPWRLAALQLDYPVSCNESRNFRRRGDKKFYGDIVGLGFLFNLELVVQVSLPYVQWLKMVQIWYVAVRNETPRTLVSMSD